MQNQGKITYHALLAERHPNNCAGENYRLKTHNI
jgi:hypothetical protein